MDKVRIAIDMDDVMADTLTKALQLYKDRFGVSIPVEALHGMHLKDYLPKEHAPVVWEFLHSPGFFRDLPIMEDCQEVMKALWEKHEVFIVSAAMEFPFSLKEKHDWLQEFFPYIHWKNMVLCGDKSIINADYIIDDHAKNLVNFTGKEAYMFTAPHNMKETRFKRLNNWKEVADRFL